MMYCITATFDVLAPEGIGAEAVMRAVKDLIGTDIDDGDGTVLTVWGLDVHASWDVPLTSHPRSPMA